MKIIKMYDGAFFGSNELEYSLFEFSGGERHIKILDNIQCGDQITIESILSKSSDVFDILLATDALRRMGCGDIILKIPYIPYSRQDRACEIGEAFSLKVFAGIINSQKYKSVVTQDPHSLVCGALINNLEVDNSELINNIYNIVKNKMVTPYIVCPDAGAEKTIYEKIKQSSIDGLYKWIVLCRKVRCTTSGDILKTEVYCDDIDGNQFLIVDDICDGGRTFIEIAKILKRKGAGRIVLLVTHGIFSNGFGVFDDLIDEVCCVNKIGDKNNG